MGCVYTLPLKKNFFCGFPNFLRNTDYLTLTISWAGLAYYVIQSTYQTNIGVFLHDMRGVYLKISGVICIQKLW